MGKHGSPREKIETPGFDNIPLVKASAATLDQMVSSFSRSVVVIDIG
jgi:hypothetical protein